MRQKYFILILIGFFQFYKLSSADWSVKITSKNSISYGLMNSDVVFLGELLTSDSNNLTYSFRILELFKGKVKSDTIYGKANSDYLIFPSDFGLWIVYAQFNQDSTSIKINENSSTMSMKWAHYFGPPPPSKIYSKDFKSDRILDSRIDKLEDYNNGLRDWFYDLERLRKYKDSYNVIEQKSKLDYKWIFLILSFVLNVLMFTIIMFRLKNK